MRKNYKNLMATTYTEKFEACKQSWIRGAIVGAIISIIIGFMCSDCKLNEEFFTATGIAILPAIFVIATTIATQRTGSFGVGRFPKKFEFTPEDIGRLVRCGMLGKTFVAIGLGFKAFVWFIALSIFTFAFPIETIYYLIRANEEKKNESVEMDEQMNVAA